MILIQEEIENRTVTLMISTSKLTGNVLKSAIAKYLAYRSSKKAAKAASSAKQRDSPVKPTGKQTVKELIGQNQGVSNIEVAKSGIRDFERVARKYGVDYAIRKDTSGKTPKYLVFFKARDGDALTAAFREYAVKAVKRGKMKPSVLDELHKYAAQTVDTPVRGKRKELER